MTVPTARAPARIIIIMASANNQDKWHGGFAHAGEALRGSSIEQHFGTYNLSGGLEHHLAFRKLEGRRKLEENYWKENLKILPIHQNLYEIA